MSHGDTIFALSSGRPPAAIAIIRISGRDAHAAGSALAGDLPAAREAGVRTLRDPASGELLDEAMVLRFDAPRSATGEDSVELHCHGGRAVVEAVLAALAAQPGLRQAEPGEFTRRALENGRIDLLEAEALADLISAETQSQRRLALLSAEGGLSRQVDRWREIAVGLSACAEAAIDYAEEDDVAADPAIARECAALEHDLREWLSRPRAEPLKDGVRVVIAGPPNSGKSSLLNAIAGTERAIVSDIPGTTRDHVEVALAIAGIPVTLTDTAGLRAADDAIEIIGIAKTHQLLQRADVVVWLGAAEDAPDHARLIKVHSKCDLPGREVGAAGSIVVSAKTSRGVGNLMQAIGKAARNVIPGDGALALNERQATALREAAEALLHAHAEAPPEIVADALREALNAFDRLTGRSGVEDALDALFSRFCLGK